MPSREFIEKAKSGDMDVYTKILKRLAGFIHVMKLRYSFGIYDHDDIEQECKIKILNAIKTYDYSSEFYFFIRDCVVRYMKTLAEKQFAIKRVANIKTYPLDNHQIPSDPPIAEIVRKNSREAFFKFATRNLSDFETKMFDLFYMQDLSYKEIEMETGIEAKRVDNALCRVRAKIGDDREELCKILIPYSRTYARKLFTSEQEEFLDIDSFGYWSLGIKILEGDTQDG